MKKRILLIFAASFLLVGCGGNNTSTIPQMDVAFNDQTITYDGNEHTIVATGYPEGSEVNYVNEGPFINVGTYLIGVEITHPNYQTFTDLATLTINEGVIDAVFDDVTVTYDGNPHTIEATDYPQGSRVSYANNGPFVNVGEYPIQVTIECENYHTFTKTAILTIEKREMTGVSFANKTVTYDGFTHTIDPTGYPEGSQITYLTEKYFTEPGAHEITVKISHPDYKDYIKTAILKIKDIEGEVYETTAKALLKDHPSKTNLNNQSQRIESCGINLTFHTNKGTNNPIYNNDNGGSLRLYANNSLTIEAPVFNSLPTIEVVKIEFTCLKEEKVPLDASISSGRLSFPSSTTFVWSGTATSLVLTIGTAPAWITNFKITYVNNEHMIDSLPGISSIATIKERATEIRYIPSNDGWYLTPTEVTVQVQAIDCIDSTATSGTLPGDARGKVLCVDKTGYILASSATSITGGVTLYSRVKDYLKAGTTTYEIHGRLAFLNGVLEINVMSFEYKEDLIIEKNYDSYVEKSYLTQQEFADDIIKNVKYNPKGYGVTNVVKFSSLTCFNCYNNKAGSYLFLDANGDLVPVYSYLQKDKSNISLGYVYDVIGLATTYNYRPSLRIMKITKVDKTPCKFDYVNNVEKIGDLSGFYDIKPGDNEQYVKSELTMYSADVYVSCYANDKYTFNTNYWVGRDEHNYTTGVSQADAANKKSLGIFNENLDYKQTLTDFIIDGCKDDEEVRQKKVTLYFTLAFVDTVDGKSMWRVNVLEDLVKSLDYVNGERLNMTFHTSSEGVSCIYEEKVYQQWSYSGLVVRNEANKIGSTTYQIKRDPTQLIVAQNTKLILRFDREILGFTFFHSTYSSFAFLEGLEIRCFDQRKDHTEIVLKNPTNEVIIDVVGLTGENYIKIPRMELVYKK